MTGLKLSILTGCVELYVPPNAVSVKVLQHVLPAKADEQRCNPTAELSLLASS